jgi:Ca2+-binding EF-hand superfamily protein
VNSFVRGTGRATHLVTYAAMAFLWGAIASPATARSEEPKNAANSAGLQTAAESVDLICLLSKRPVVIRLHLTVDGKPMSEFRAAIARRLFNAFDTDKNGLLEGKELDALPTPQMVAAAGREPGMPPQVTASSAPNVHKGPVTPQEWARFLFPNSSQNVSIAMPSSSDSAMASPSPEMSALSSNGELSLLLSTIDADHDGRLSAAELSRADDLFRLFDLNDDEQISKTELISAADLASTFGVSQGNPTEAGAPLEAIPRTADKKALIKRLIQSFATEQPAANGRILKKDDRPKSAPRQLGIPAQSIVGRDDAAKYDKNGDGLLDEQELTNWLSHPEPQCELAVELAAASLQEPRVKVLRVAPSAREAGLIVEAPSAGRVLLRMAGHPLELRAAEPSRRAAARTSRYRAQFKRADQNNNGYLEKFEISALGQGLEPVDFEAMDRDHNGMVFEEEWLTYMRLRDALAEGRLSLSLASESIDPIAEFDANHDGRLNRSELGRALAVIAAWDRNRDGFVTRDEVPTTLVGTFHSGPPRSVSMRRPNYPRMARSQPSPPAVGPVWFQKMDRNHDGEVSLREFLGPLEVFRRLDTNGDGRLDIHEAESAQK